MHPLKMRPLTGILFWFIIIIVIYAAAIYVIRPEVNVDRQEQRIKNQIRAERYLYSQHAFEYVIAGSSMTARLPDKALGDGLYKLSFGGGTPIAGLEIITRSGKLPDVVIVEINALATRPLDGLVDKLFSPGSTELKRYFPFLRTEYRPVSLLVSMLVADEPSMREHGVAGIQEPDEAMLRVLENNVRRAEESDNHSPPEPMFTDNLDRLERLVRELEKKGVRIIFLEMPLNPRVAATRYRNSISEQVRSRFPVDSYRWIIPGDEHEYMTTDGVHLTKSEAWHVADYISSQIRAVGNQAL